MAYRKNRRNSQQIRYITWLALWMDMRGFTIETMARMLCCCEMSVKNWRRARTISRHMAQLIRSRFPEAPVDLRGGHVHTLKESLPVNARSPELYRFLLRKMGVIEERTPIWPVALELARGIKVGSEPEQVAVAGGEVHPDGV